MRKLILMFFLMLSFTIVLAGCQKQRSESKPEPLVSLPVQNKEAPIEQSSVLKQEQEEQTLLADIKSASLDIQEESENDILFTTSADVIDEEIPLLKSTSLFDPNTLTRVESPPEELDIEKSNNLEVGSELPLTNSAQIPNPIHDTEPQIVVPTPESTEFIVVKESPSTLVEVTPKQPLAQTGDNLNLGLLVMVGLGITGGIVWVNRRNNIKNKTH